jgi:SAM-dependent methyltransferase
LRERLISMLRGARFAAEATQPARERPVPRAIPESNGRDTSDTRQSRGLEQFFAPFRDQTGLSILDLGGARQENINFVTSLGHRFYSEDFIRIFQETFGQDVVDQANAGRIDFFLRQGLDYPDEQFDGVLAWDVLEYMEPALLMATTEKLWRVLKPQGYLLAFFQSPDRKETVPGYDFRIQDLRTLQVSHNSDCAPTQQIFNNRSLEKIFQKFESVKFFLTRDRLREVIVRK